MTLKWTGLRITQLLSQSSEQLCLDHSCNIKHILDNYLTNPNVNHLVKNNVSGIYLPTNCTSSIHSKANSLLCLSKYQSHFVRLLLNVGNSGRSTS